MFNTSSSGPLAAALGSGSNITHSEYFDGVCSGEYRNGILCQNLENLSLENDCFDLVVTEDVLEHLEHPVAGIREIHRVLKPGGHHIFTVPFSFDRKTELLYDRVDGKTVLKEPREFHGDPIRGAIAAYVRFGYDLFDRLALEGFAARIECSPYAQYRRMGTYDCYTFVTVKREV